MARTLYDKIWAAHVVKDFEDDAALLYVDLHLIHEVTTPQAFSGLTEAARRVRRPERTLAMADHNVPTAGQAGGAAAIADEESRLQVEMFERNVAEHRIDYLAMGAADVGIVHVVAPEIGRSQPGMVIVCGDSHTSTHGAFGALAFGIGTSEVEHVLATQTIRVRKAKSRRVVLRGMPRPGVGAKDIALAVIAALGTGWGTGSVIEFVGESVDAMSMEARMTLCNMAIEAGARSGIVAPDATTRAYLDGLPFAPTGAARGDALAYWATLASDAHAVFDRVAEIDVAAIAPMVSWGTSPEQAIAIDGHVPTGDDPALMRARDYMGLAAGAPLAGTPVDIVFIGSCTNGRIEDLRAAAAVLRGRRIAPSVRALIVPGSQRVRDRAIGEGLDRIFRDAGCEWREPGCSMCIGLNGDRLMPGQRAASTSNRNFEGRQGTGGRTHLMGPAMAAAAAVDGCLTDARAYL